MKTKKTFSNLCIFFLLLLITLSASAQSVDIPKGTKLYVVQESDTKLKSGVPDLREDLQKMLDEWGHFTVVDNPTDAQMTLNLHVEYVKESALTSFSVLNRKAAQVEARLLNNSKQELWQCEKFQVGEKGMIGYNFGKAAMKTLVKKMKKDIK